jgi:hypothetical protein
LNAEFTAIDAVLARSEAVITEAMKPTRPPVRERDPLVYDLHWDEDVRYALSVSDTVAIRQRKISSEFYAEMVARRCSNNTKFACKAMQGRLASH